MYYSTGILSRALPNAASYVSLGVAVINVIMTFPPIFLIEVRTIVKVTPGLTTLVAVWSTATITLVGHRQHLLRRPLRYFSELQPEHGVGSWHSRIREVRRFIVDDTSRRISPVASPLGWVRSPLSLSQTSPRSM